MSADELRALEIDASERVLNAGPLARRFISNDDRRLARANRAFWQAADETTLQRLLGFYQQVNVGVRDEPPEPETEETT